MLKFAETLIGKSMRWKNRGARIVLASLAAGCLFLPALAEAGSQSDKHGQTQGSVSSSSARATKAKVSPYVIASRQHTEELRAAHSHSVQSPALSLAGRRTHKLPGQVQR